MPASKHYEFTLYTEKGREFIKIWNSAYMDGIQKTIAERFGISIAVVYRIRKKLNLPGLHDMKNHPGKRKLCKRIRKLYITKERSSLQIAKIFKMSPENVRNILLKMKVEMKPQHVTNPAYFPTKSSLTPTQLLKEIKRLYCDENIPARKIALILRIDQGTVRTKLKAMGIPIRHIKTFEEKITVTPNYNIKGIWLGTSEPFRVTCNQPRTSVHNGRSLERRSTANCLWCNAEFRQYIDKGPRTQLYCSSSCKNKAKDYRRMVRGTKTSKTRLSAFTTELRKTWGKDWQKTRKIILHAKPIINQNPLNTDKRRMPNPAQTAQPAFST